MSNSVVPDETAHYEPSHLDLRFSLRCLQKKNKNKKETIIIAHGSEGVYTGPQCVKVPSYI